MKKKKFMNALIALLLAVFASITLFPASTEAAPPPAYDWDGNRVELPPFKITAASLPSSNEVDRKANNDSWLLRTVFWCQGWTLTKVSRQYSVRTYVYERIVGSYKTEAFVLYQSGRTFWYDGTKTRYNQSDAVKALNRGKVKTFNFIY